MLETLKNLIVTKIMFTSVIIYGACRPEYKDWNTLREGGVLSSSRKVCC
jgi:hypothetical protein